MWYTIYFWKRVIQFGEMRYILHGLVVHLLWAITWGIVSLPMVEKWRQWSEVKLNVVAAISSDKNPEKALEVLKEVRPFSFGVLVGSGLFGIVSFIFPVVFSAVKSVVDKL